MLQATKKRDLQTGKIIGYELIDKPDLSGKLVLVVDDICDGGGTFLALSNAIDEHSGNACEKHLYVTHGIFSKGKEVLNNHYSKVFCYNDMSQENDK
jgi:ribose-phosphate pyrophosphokinase